MLRVSAIQWLKQIGRLFLLGMRLVGRRCVRQKSQRVEHLCFDIFPVRRSEIAHRVLVVQHPRAVRNGVSVLIYQAQCMDELTLAFRTCPDLLCLLDFRLRNRNCRRCNWRIPKLVKVRHSHSPMCHRTLRIQFGHTLKCIFCGGVSEGVKQRHASVELLLSGRHARNRKRYLPQFLGCAVVVSFLRGREGKDEQQGEPYPPEIGLPHLHRRAPSGHPNSTGCYAHG